jgi:23S rRNA (adenine2503-C2)-methyltransferase
VDERINLLGMARPSVEALFERLGERPFRARQVMQWMYRRGVSDFDAMTDLGKGLRGRLAEAAEITPPEIGTHQGSEDGTRKWLLRMDSVQGIETVYIPEPRRKTLCISSQVGCALDCKFCATGRQGFNRNLSAAEIIGQVWLAHSELGFGASIAERPISNVVFMGMGEPLANYRNLVPALDVLLDDFGFSLSRRRVTVSTSGLVPMIDRLRVDKPVSLAISLHASDDALRDELVPINRRHPIAELLDACWRYAPALGDRDITFEYVMLEGVNDSAAQARDLARLLRDRPAKVNLIPFNPFPGTGYRRSAPETIEDFRQELVQRGVLATIRRTRGDDIDAACGQLAGRVKDRTKVRLGDKMTSVAVQS